MTDEGTKVCTLCRQRKPVAAFSIRNSHRGGRASRCRHCETERARAYNKGISEVPALIMEHAMCYLAWHDRNYPTGYRTSYFREEYDPMTTEDIGLELDRIQLSLMAEYGERAKDAPD